VRPDDKGIAAVIKAGDGEAEFAAFAAARTGALGRTAYLLTGDHHLAEDLVQATLFKTAKAWGRIRGNPEAYARRVMYHENISWWRRRRLDEVSVAEPPEHGSPGEDVEMRLVLMRALARLTAKQRTVLVLRYFEDLSESQVAAALGISLGTVKSQTRHSLQRLRTLAPDLADLVGVIADD
jgi:RNA polymerase sigma-70 factor (sigma-E family)